MANYETLWATPFLRIAMEPLSHAATLRECILSKETDANRHPNSPQRNHAHVFESTFDFLTWPDEPVQAFRQTLFSHVGGFVKEVNNFSLEELQALKFDFHCWFHITRSSGYFQPHNHANASWSCIYCVDPGDDLPDDSSHAGHVFFQDPRASAGMFIDPANRLLDRTLSFNAIRFRPRAGELIVFPSFLQHAVEPYEGERPRITVAANFWFSRS